MPHQPSADPATEPAEEDRRTADPNTTRAGDPDNVPQASAGPEDPPVDPAQPLNPA